MKQQMIGLALVFLLLSAVDGVANPLKNMLSNNQDQVIEQIAVQVVDALPDDIHMRLLAIGPIEGDDGAFVDKLTEQIKTRTKYHLIERKDLNKLLTEQGVQLSPISDDIQPIEPGKIKGVEALIVAKFISNDATIFKSSAQIFVKVDNVETGDIVFAKKFSAQYTSPIARQIGIGALGLVVFMLIVSRLKRHKQDKKEHFVRNDDSQQVEFLNDLKRARDNLTRVHDMLMENDQMALSTKVTDANQNLKHLVAQVEHTPGLKTEFLEDNEKTKMTTTTKSMKGLAKNVFAESEKLYSVADNQHYGKVETLVKSLQEEIKNCTNRFQDRASGYVS